MPSRCVCKRGPAVLENLLRCRGPVPARDSAPFGAVEHPLGPGMLTASTLQSPGLGHVATDQRSQVSAAEVGQLLLAAEVASAPNHEGAQTWAKSITEITPA